LQKSQFRAEAPGAGTRPQNPFRKGLPRILQNRPTPRVNFGSGSDACVPQDSLHALYGSVPLKFVPNVRRNYLKARGFPRDSGLVRNGLNPPSHESRSLLFGRISPREG